MPSCVVKGCRNRSSDMKKNQGITFHRFPKENEVWRDDWINIIRACRCQEDWTPTKYSVICSVHFNDNDIYTTIGGLFRIVTFAVPKKFLNEPKEQSDETYMPSAVQQTMETTTEFQDESQAEDMIQDLSSGESATQPSPPETVATEAVLKNPQMSSDTKICDDTSKETLLNSIAEVFNLDATKLSDVDKFKRRLIRSIARYMFVEKVPEEEMWTKLRKDTDCDCHLLWKRMRALTLKKLRRLLAAEDRWENITKVARLSTTDWLLFDLVLVHEKVDLIGQDILSEENEEPNVLYELFELVQKYKIEVLYGEQLIRAWVFLTLEYNRQGRQCSPMLLQRRWYQMKQLARIKFYNFWFAYGGAPTKLEKAWGQKPTDLQAEIAKKYRFIIVKPFPEWEELVLNKRVILRENFENLTVEEPANNVNVSDVQIIETPVETIHINEDSDAEDVATSQDQSDKTPQDTDTAVLSKPNDEKLEIRIDNIKSEVPEQISNSDGLTDVQVLEAMHIPIQQKHLQTSDIDLNSGFESDSFRLDENPNEFHNEVLPKITSVTGGVELLDSDDDSDDALITLPQQIASNESNKEAVSQNIANSTVNIPEDVCTSTIVPDTNSATSSNKDKCADEKQDFEVQLDDLIIIDDGIDLEDDGIELHEEDGTEDLITNIKSEPKQCEENKDEIDEASNFDYKLLLTPVVYTKKLNHMDVFKFIDYNKVRDIRIIECSYIESKPINKENIEVTKDISEQLHSDQQEYVRTESMENAYEEDGNSSECVSDSQRVKYSSWILQKPKNRSYNPIQLCKNPDFNTRLKRLNAGFLSCEKNRLLLKECKRLTIDLHKSFENKLIDGKIYLKNSKFTDNSQKIDTYTQAFNMDPSTREQIAATKVSISNIVPIISSSNINQTILKSETSVQLENNNGNNLTDTCKVNNKLLTVEITPIKANNINYKPPVEIVADLNAEHTEQDQDIINQDQTSNKLENCETSKVSNEDNMNGLQLKVKESTECIDLDQVNSTILRRINKHRFQNILSKTLINGPKNYRFGYTINTPTRTPVTWNKGPRPPKNTKEKDMFGDVLLASDTLEKMLKLLSNQTIDDKRKKKKRKMIALELAEKYDDNNDTKGIQEDKNEKIYKRKRTIPIENNVTTDTEIDTKTEIATKKPVIPKKGRPKKVDSQGVSHLKTSRYCCWALEKLVTNKIPKEPHYCPKPICICCCRDRLLKKSLQDKQGRANATLFPQDNKDSKTRKDKGLMKEKTTPKLVPSYKKLNPSSMQKNDLTLDIPIVLSDDDDDENKTCQSFEMNANNVCQNQTENTNSNPHTNSEENTEKTSHNVAEGTKNTSEISEGLEINIPESSIVEDTTLTLQSNVKGSNLSCKTRVYAKPPSVFVNSSSSTNIQVPSNELSQNISSQYIIQQTTNINPSFQYNSKDAHTSIAKLHDILSSAQKNIKESIKLSGNDVYLKESLFNNSLSTNNINPSKVPIFLGKNKILLCSNNASSQSPTIAGNKITEEAQAILPPGVQIVLLPSNELALSIEPGISFTPDEINKLSEILTAVQQQLNISVEDMDRIKNSEVFNIDIQSGKNTEIDNKNLSENVLTKQSNEQKSDYMKQSIEVESATSSACQNNKDESRPYDSLPKVVTKTLDSETVSVQKNLDSETVSVQKNLDSETASVQKSLESETVAVQKNLDSETVSVQKSLESETVSVIGVLDKIKENSADTQEILYDAHIDAQTLENSIDSAAQNNKKSILSDLMEMSGISENDAICDDKIQINASKECTKTPVCSVPIGTIPRNETVKVLYNDQISSHFDILNQPVVSKALEKRKELNIVSSFAELKDCHEKSCQFYKMDIETGKILPINLKIKRGITTTKRKRIVKQFVDPKCIIDLTDDQVNLTEETTSTTPEASTNKTSGIVIKPIKLIRSIRSIGSNRNKSIALRPLKPSSLKPNDERKLLSILKQSLLSKESNTSSDLNNTATEKINSNEETNNETHDINDSDSDDEPLAKKALRKRENDLSVSELDTVSSKNSVIEEIVDDELTEYLIPEFLEPDNIESNDEDAEENCILGV